ncbi:MAG: SH3 domain-containing protein [Phycisphaerales bacterium]|nr:MAG: SH3 domain-containing protein [Phycisphaerales bacterium]
MRFTTNLFIIAVLAGLASVGLSQGAVEGTASEDVETPPFPYDAVITGDDVYIRSGPGTNFYHCGKFNQGDRVRVVAKQFSWSRIVPPAGSFSWISMQYVKIDPANPGVGVVTGDNVRVYAGSDFVKPLYSTTLQGKLNTGDKVKLLGEQMDEYYKIAPPPAAYLWVSTNFTKPAPAPVEPPPATAVAPSPGVQEPNEAVVVTPPVVTPQSALEKYRALKQQVEAERAKPTDQQDYSELKKSLAEIAKNESADKAARYAEFVLRQIEGYELALAVTKEIRLQNEQLQKIKAGIEKARETRLAEIQDLGRFAVTGEFQTYATFGPGHYRIVGDSGSMVCYALPAGSAAQRDLSGLIGRKVGLIGTIEPHKPTAGALVRFTNIVELK